MKCTHALPLIENVRKKRTDYEIPLFLTAAQWNIEQIDFQIAQRLCRDHGVTLISHPLGIPILNVKHGETHLFMVDSVQSSVWKTYHGIKVLCRHLGINRPIAQAYAVCAVLPRPTFTNLSFPDLVQAGYAPNMVKFRQFIYQVYNW